jgi:hypothetical protein
MFLNQQKKRAKKDLKRKKKRSEERKRDLFVNVVFEIGEDVRIVGIDGNQLLHCV